VHAAHWGRGGAYDIDIDFLVFPRWSSVVWWFNEFFGTRAR
jgi:hypothetical protein